MRLSGYNLELPGFSLKNFKVLLITTATTFFPVLFLVVFLTEVGPNSAMIYTHTYAVSSSVLQAVSIRYFASSTGRLRTQNYCSTNYLKSKTCIFL